MKVRVKCIQNYFDIEENERKVINTSVPYDEPDKHPNRVEWITDKKRADHLVSKELVKIIEYIDDEKKEKKINPIKPEKKTIKKK